MTEPLSQHQTSPEADKANTAPAVALPDVNARADAIATAAPEKPKRTLGLKIFDNLLYTIFTNTSVFLMSVGFTYMTKHGTTIGQEGSVARKVGSWFAGRRKYILQAFEKIGVTGKAADNGTTVFFSFADGTLFAPFVKLLEDRREKIAKKLDDALGTTPENLRAYDAEPKQSWRSVVEGRIMTSAIVVPVAIAMEETGGNQKIFYNSGNALASFVEKNIPKLDRWLAKKTIHHRPYFFQTAVFEAFYTSVCTIGLYAISRMLARKHPKPEKISAALPDTALTTANASTSSDTPASHSEQSSTAPTTTISQVHHAQRLASPSPAAELTA